MVISVSPQSNSVALPKSPESSVQVELTQTLPGFVLEPTQMFAHPSYLYDIYKEGIEQIYFPEKEILDAQVTVKVQTGYTNPRQFGSWRWRAYRWAMTALREIPAVDCTGTFILDARSDADGHIGHILENYIIPIRFAEHLLSQHLGQLIKIHVVLRKTATALGRQVYDTLDVPVICTDEQVYGNIVTITTDVANAKPNYMQALLALGLDLNFKGYNPNTPERIFIPRRGKRQLKNNDAVTQYLEKRGFTTYYFEDLTPSEEWSITRNAKVIVAIHGAACSNFVFNQVGLQPSSSKESGVRLLEIFSPAFVLPGYRYVAPLVNGRWCAVRGQVTPRLLQQLDFSNKPRNLHKSPMKDPFEVSLESLERALEYLGVD
ncbi:MAG: glycosyltransferase family 61 protein [Oculatellaceae cyanobacterium Prado106]|jgi:hypothetical protein|nr:glycosyltransferase family 61 protein [Oculatellaceae cyanobacterium Prado106]